MTGAELFRLFRPIIIIATLVLNVLPQFVGSFFWHVFNSFPGIVGAGIRYCIVKSRARQCGDNVFVGPDVEIRNINKLSIGSNVSINRFSYIDAEGSITIGNFVRIAEKASLISTNHTWNITDVPIAYCPLELKEIIIEDDVWLGSGAKVLAGVTIHSRSIVAAGAVVINDVKHNTLVGGVPARIIKLI